MRANEHDLNSLRGMIRRLQEENASLKRLLDENNILYASSEILDVIETPDEYDEDQGARIIPLNPDTDMAKEFYSYFWGRTDVYARRGKAGGYFPRCSAWWDNPACPKKADKKKFCDEDCPYKSWEELTPKTILCHLKGYKEDCTDVIGVYPLFPNNTCHFLVFDFDNHEKDSYKNDDANTDDLRKSEVDSLRRICKLAGIDALTERSRSGRGAHIWIFFKTAIPAATARNFGYALLDKGVATIDNPEYWKRDRLGKSNYYNSRTISMWSESEGYIRLPAGLYEGLESKCEEAGISVDKYDKRSHGRPIRVKFKGELRDQQALASLRLEKYENGILCAPPAFGNCS